MIVNKLRDLSNPKGWTRRPKHRNIFMFCVSMLTAVCKPENVAVIERLADVFDERHLITGPRTETLISWPILSDDEFVLDGALLWYWLVHSDQTYTNIAVIPYEYRLRYTVRRMNVERFHYDASRLQVQPTAHSDLVLLKAAQWKIAEYDSIVEALYNCMHSPQERRGLTQRLRQAAGSNLCKQILEMASYIRSNPGDRSVCGIYADALDEIGATAAAQHMRTKTHCRACWAVISL